MHAHAPAAETCVGRCGDLPAEDGREHTPLSEAAVQGHLEVVRFGPKRVSPPIRGLLTCHRARDASHFLCSHELCCIGICWCGPQLEQLGSPIACRAALPMKWLRIGRPPLGPTPTLQVRRTSAVIVCETPWGTLPGFGITHPLGQTLEGSDGRTPLHRAAFQGHHAWSSAPFEGSECNSVRQDQGCGPTPARTRS